MKQITNCLSNAACMNYKLRLNENLVFFIFFDYGLKLFSEFTMWDHRSSDFYQRQHAPRGLGGRFPGYACKKGSSCRVNEATQARQRGMYGLFY